ncbi:rab geranylgeranyltransferase [Dacryopinax primogenitus]|uniref:Geranylgeranyl transferase type-2 subunit beta n=1 Tax=Dacryopinax primogenitus (strain DJM 731) TaxID=1858805 RepID=M5FRS8_DACPD|nr:rab geranylgeranyltransferase [Dacryopinax primogenitus]EJT99925.1 rab geranylgeranyltransferase [Dacryopinax primogenitus]
MDALLIDKHVKYIQSLGENTDDLMYHLTAHLRLNAIYWGLTALFIMGHPEALVKEDVIAFVMSCWDDDEGAFGAHPGHDAHVLPTLSSIQILVMYDEVERADKERLVSYLAARQNPSGSFSGDRWGETDTRFSYITLQALELLGRLDAIDKEKAVAHIRRCKNYDGGFGATEGAESHSGQVFVCTAALTILDRLDEIDQPNLAWWLAERQLPNGGLNGRPEKLEDVCYSFWVLSALSILHKLKWIDSDALIRFILSAQDPDGGGIADRPGDMVDVFHTVFGLCGLSLLGHPDVREINPIYCLPAEIAKKRGLHMNYQVLGKDEA